MSFCLFWKVVLLKVLYQLNRLVVALYVETMSALGQVAYQHCDP